MKESLRRPDLSGSPLELVQAPTHFELAYTVNTHYDSIISITGELCTSSPDISKYEIHVDQVL